MSAESFDWLPLLGCVDNVSIDVADRAPDEGSGGRDRLGGLLVDICGLKVTVRAGLAGGLGRWDEEDVVGMRGARSGSAAEEAMLLQPQWKASWIFGQFHAVEQVRKMNLH